MKIFLAFSQKFFLTFSLFSLTFSPSLISSCKYVVEAVFACQESSPQLVAEKIKTLQQQREESQPIRAKTGGSTFKNPENQHTNLGTNLRAWQLIDAVGLRGHFIGDACFSSKHCNFLINTKQATSQNLLDLGKLAQEKVQEKFNIPLQWELKLI